MAEAYLGEIRLFSFNFAPKNWALCNGQFLPINQNQALFSLFGTQFGGNGQTTFALPDLRGRVPIHMGNGHTIGEAAGQAAVTLSLAQLPQHFHFLQASGGPADSGAVNTPPTGNYLTQAEATQPGGVKVPVNRYANPPGTLSAMNASAVSSIGGSQPHQNMMPFLAMNFCVALIGIFPSQN